MSRTLVSLLALVVLIAAACGGDDDDGAPSGVTTAVPTRTAEATSTPARTPTPAATSTPAPPSSTTRPTPLSNQLAALGGEDSAVIANLLGDLTPRCQQSEEEVAELLERAWRALRETYDVALPVTSIMARIIFELPAGTSRENCETLITAVITEIVGGG